MTESIELLSTRRSVSIPSLVTPGPTDTELETLLTIASRVPDHGKLAPWRFIVLQGDGAALVSKATTEILDRKEGPLSEQRRTFEEARFTRTPVVIGVVSRARPHFKIPEWEQVLSVGAATMNLIHAAHALGFAANWITEWVTYDDDAKAVLGVQPEERLAGFVHIGTPADQPSDRPRPPLDEIVTVLSAPAAR